MVWIPLVLAACKSDDDPFSPPGDDPIVDETLPPGARCPAAPPVGFNELSPSNVAALHDEDGDTVDWIEIVNVHDAPVDLAGWTLSDDPEDPGKWRFPSMTLAPDELLLVYASDKDRATIVGAWDVRIDAGDPWRYLEVTSAPDPGWNQPGFDDAAWPVGPSGIGNGDGDDATDVAADTVYARATFEVTAEELADLRHLWLFVDHDDGFVAYLNGVEVARNGIGLPGQPVAWDALATIEHEALGYQGGKPPRYDLAAAVDGLVAGTNTLAIEVHDHKTTSTDLSLVPILALGFASEREGRTSSVLSLPTRMLHTNFSLSAEGEAVRLFDPTGCEMDVAEPKVELRADESYGASPTAPATTATSSRRRPAPRTRPRRAPASPRPRSSSPRRAGTRAAPT